jgi:hypothetical protein
MRLEMSGKFKVSKKTSPGKRLDLPAMGRCRLLERRR